MMTQRSYDCFDAQGNGHFSAVDDLFDRGVWIGYLAEASGIRYRQLPSFHDLEINQKNINLPCPPVIPHTACTDREAVCRGCIGESSSLLQLHEIRFGPNSKVVVMPLRGPGNVDLFCIMLPQPQDRSIKALELFRPYEHSTDRDDYKSFANDYMLLSIRDRRNNSGLIHMACNTLSSVELAKVANRTGISRSSLSLGSNGNTTTKPTAENSVRSGGQPRLKRKLQKTYGNDSGANSSVKRNRRKPLQGSKMNKRSISLSDDDMEDSPLLQHARSSVLETGAQHPGTVSPTNTVNVPSLQTLQVPLLSINNLQITEEQACRIHFVWKVKFEDTEIEARRTLGATKTFRGLLDSFQREADHAPSAARQIKAGLWIMKYKLADGKSKAVFINPSSPDSEHSFDSILRSLAEQEEWKLDKSVIVEIELRALTSGGVV